MHTILTTARQTGSQSRFNIPRVHSAFCSKQLKSSKATSTVIRHVLHNNPSSKMAGSDDILTKVFDRQDHPRLEAKLSRKLDRTKFFYSHAQCILDSCSEE